MYQASANRVNNIVSSVPKPLLSSCRDRWVSDFLMSSLKFKDGNRLNCERVNLEWAPSLATRDEATRARAIATRERADAARRSLEGRHHSDSAELVSEDRQR